MFQYFKKFGDKPCCFTDLKVFVDLLPSSQYTKVREDQEAVAGTAALVCALVPFPPGACGSYQKTGDITFLPSV